MTISRMRPTKYEYYMNIVNVVKQRSLDAETQVGAILVHNNSGAIIMSGYNNYIRNAPDQDLPNTRPDKYPLILHAEDNLIANCARHGISMEDCTVFISVNPCTRCTRLLWQCGITSVIIEKVYEQYFEKVKNMPDLSVSIEPVEQYFKLTYKKKQN